MYNDPKILSLFFVLVLQVMILQCNGYCWQSGWNPTFISEPKVEQLSLMKVRVSWDGIVDKRKCADSFLIKYWRKSSPASYKMTTPVPTEVSYEDIEVSPKVIYLYQVIAREDKGMILGVDYNKAKPVEFRTSSFNEQISSDSSNIPGGVVNNKHGNSKAPYDPRVNDKAINIMGLTIETLVIIIVVGLILVLVIIGIAYKLCCGGKKSSKYDDDDDDEESGVRDDDDDDDDDDDEDQWDVRFGPKEMENESLQSNQNAKHINRNFSHKNSNGLNYRSNLKDV